MASNGFQNPFRAPCSQEIYRVVLHLGGHNGQACIIAHTSQVVTSAFRSWLRIAAADLGGHRASSKDSISWAHAVPPWPWQQPCYSRASFFAAVRQGCAEHHSSCRSCHRLEAPSGIRRTLAEWGSCLYRWDRIVQGSRETGTSADCNLVWANPGTSSCAESVDRLTRWCCVQRKDYQTCRIRPWRVRRCWLDLRRKRR